jgi:ABC-type transport system involved in multi-copper enzyme maturation permease subunit
MTPARAPVFAVLAREALADAMRRRLVLVIAVACLLSLQAVESCTSCGSATLVRDGQTVELPDVAGFGALAVMLVCSLWTLLLAGFLASDHLTEPLEDGSAALLLARPVGRGEFALARLAGALAIALAAGALLLLATGALLHARQGLAWWPVLPAFAACAVGAATVGALAMLASLYLPRVATILLVMMGVGLVAAVNVAGLFGAELGGLATAVQRFGPPLVSPVALALRDWIAPTAVPGDALILALRQIAWMLASAALLVHAFRRVELA